ncbi:alpha/beta fold hydrolase [Methylopila sp. M107]|uniref:alpha/beta fold hydrolase n=1 Tax=Methylopila sp. M107 TaxID=1101190 RepID=UPI00036E6567|nr:alpha/beta fold hydrolase [Methylopila sp. M107]
MARNDKREEGDDLARNAAETMLGPNPFVGLRFTDLTRSLLGAWGAVLKNPTTMLEQYGAFLRGTMAALDPSSDGVTGDKRFADPEWRDNPAYRSLMQVYLNWAKSFVGLVDALDLEPFERERARFVLTLIADTLSPTNTLVGNPTAFRKTLESKGANLASGLSNLVSDLVRNEGMPSQVDKSAFDVGGNIAVTPGAVVFCNEVLELIQYAPTTPSVHARPHLFIPPQINKFYVFDLTPEKSLVRFLLDKGFQVFLVSWRNPTARDRDWGIATYIAALREAVDAVKSITGSDDLIAHAACSGAMTSVILAAVLEAENNRSIRALTLMVAVLGTDADTQLGMFATPDVIEAAKQRVAKTGVLEGKEMGRVFAWMRPNDLVWNYWINNYLLGNRPPAFDILYWNNDTTRLPAKFHGQLLDVLGQGQLLRPGALEVDGAPVDITKISADKFVLAGSTDHITPWRGVYRMAQALGGEVEFVLSSSGHIQSLVNPPGNARSKYNSHATIEPTADAWLAASTTTQGSWWERWAEWLEARSGDKVPAAKRLGDARHKPLAAAPGLYVRE